MTKDHQVDLHDMPFYWRIRRSVTDRHATIPSRLPYSFELMAELNLVIERRNPALLSCLTEMYREESNIGFLQDGHNLSKGYGGDFLDFIQRKISVHDVKKILEIGCGGCAILEQMQASGFDVTGVDPSPIAVAKGEEKNIRVIPDFFPCPQIDFKADLIFHADVLEHVIDPVGFLRQQKDGLTSDGSIIINVPDCTASIAAGDISIASHQHLNSFDDLSLFNTVAAAGLHVVTIEKSKFGGSLYCLASVKKPLSVFQVKVSDQHAKNFIRKAGRVQARFESIAKPLLDGGESVGFYMPLRSAPYLASIGRLNGFRLFDDIGHWHEGYFDGLDVPIENFNDLVRNPVDHLFIMSLTFGDVVRNKVLAQCPQTRIVVLKDIVAP